MFIQRKLPSQYPKAVEVHNMEWVVDGALRFIDKANKSEKPFFLYFATTIAHGPHRLEQNIKLIH